MTIVYKTTFIHRIQIRLYTKLHKTTELILYVSEKAQFFIGIFHFFTTFIIMLNTALKKWKLLLAI
jgi:hypothetical protein